MQSYVTKSNVRGWRPLCRLVRLRRTAVAYCRLGLPRGMQDVPISLTIIILSTLRCYVMCRHGQSCQPLTLSSYRSHADREDQTMLAASRVMTIWRAFHIYASETICALYDFCWFLTTLFAFLFRGPLSAQLKCMSIDKLLAFMRFRQESLHEHLIALPGASLCLNMRAFI